MIEVRRSPGKETQGLPILRERNARFPDPQRKRTEMINARFADPQRKRTKMPDINARFADPQRKRTEMINARFSDP